MKMRAILSTGLLVLLLVPSAWSQTVNFKEYKLKNGLRVLLSEDHTAPTYSIAVTYNAGSRDEKAGHTGFAHLFEHMMFQGSENVGKGEHLIIVENNGGNVNGNTTGDRTMYFETLPSNQVDLGLFLEADRMRSLAVTQANLDNQRKTVEEERRERYDNQPYGHTYETLIDTMYDNPANKHSTIGSMEDLDKASLADVTNFFRTYYAPNNAVLSIVGDFNSEEILKKIDKYFDDIPQQTPPPVPDVTEPKQTAERRKTIEDPLAQQTRLDVAFRGPAGDTADWFPLYVAGEILTTGRSSRIYQDMVKDKQLITSIAGGSDERRGPGMFIFQMTLRPGKDPAEVEKALNNEIERIKNEPVTDDELSKVRMAIRRNQAEEIEDTADRAEALGEYAVFFNDPNLINTFGKKVEAVTKQQIQDAAKKYLIPTNRTVITTVPKPKGGN